MTATQSQNEQETRSPKKRSPFRIGFWNNIKENKKLLIVISVLHLIGLPLLLFTAMMMVLDSNHYAGSSEGYWGEYGGFFLMIGSFGFFTALLAGLLMAPKCFQELSQKSRVDTLYALPMTTGQRFWSNYVAGLFIYVLPFICSVVLTTLLWVVGRAVSAILYEAFTMELLGMAYKGALCVLLGITLLYTVCVFVATCCGKQGESVLGSVALMIMIPVTIAVGGYVYFSNLYGISIDSLMYQLLSYAGPFGAVFFPFYELERSIDDTLSLVALFKWSAFYLLLIGIVLFLSWFLYKRRRAEDTGKPYVYRVLYHINMSALLFCFCSSVYSIGAEALVPVAFFCFIIYVLADIVTNRSLKGVPRSILQFSITIICICSFMLLIDKTNAFGIEKKVPKASQIDTVEVVAGLYGDTTFHVEEESMEYTCYSTKKNYTYPAFTYQDTETIETIIALQQELVDAYEESGNVVSENTAGWYWIDTDYFYEPGWVSPFNIIYHYKDGGTMKRSYMLTEKQWMRLAATQANEQTFDMLADFLKSAAKDDGQLIISSGITKSEDTVYPIYDKSCISELTAAIRADGENITVSEYLSPSGIYCYVNDIPIRKSFTQSIAVLQKYEMLPADEEALILESNFTGRLYAPEDTCIWGDETRTETLLIANDESFTGAGKSVSQETVVDMLAILTPYYHAESEDCYILYYNGMYFAIPSAYSAQVEKYYKDAAYASPYTEKNS